MLTCVTDYSELEESRVTCQANRLREEDQAKWDVGESRESQVLRAVCECGGGD